MSSIHLSDYTHSQSGILYNTKKFGQREAASLIEITESLPTVQNAKKEEILTASQNTLLATGNAALIMQLFFKAVALATGGIGMLGYGLYNAFKAKQAAIEITKLKRITHLDVEPPQKLFEKLKEVSIEALPLLRLERNDRIATAAFAVLLGISLFTLAGVAAYTHLNGAYTPLTRQIGIYATLSSTVTIIAWMGKNILFSHLKNSSETRARHVISLNEEIKQLLPTPHKLIEKLAKETDEKIVLNAKDTIYYLQNNEVIIKSANLSNWPGTEYESYTIV